MFARLRFKRDVEALLVLYVHSSKVQAGCKGTINEYHTFTHLRFRRNVKALLVSTIHSFVSGSDGSLTQY